MRTSTVVCGYDDRVVAWVQRRGPTLVEVMATADFSLFDGALVALATVIVLLMLQRGVRDAPFWRATVTPLASIIGSGFLVVVPLLAGIAGPFSVLAITAIVLLSLCLGDALRFIIRHDRPPADTVMRVLAHTSDLSLAAAFIVSITFYIRLMSGFVLSGIHLYTPFNADLLATLVLAFIGLYGLRRGLSGLERLEEYSVTIKLSIIAALLVGMVHFDVRNGYDLSALPEPGTDWWLSLRELGGMLLIVQGFETSRYLGNSYAADLRVRSMLLAQVLAGVIYVAFVALAMPLMGPLAGEPPQETAIIGLSARITPVLPLMLVVAAAMSQFSAAIADTIGAGGVVERESHQRVPAHLSYLVIAVLAVLLMWVSNIFEVVALASRVFAFYYMLQAAMAARLAWEPAGDRRQPWRAGAYAALALLMLLVVLFARSMET
ncbi:hypothetical protein [Haliea sp. E17]|uniref:hypothetical protein n=1 Tax=Haliea sp. E17 TaxID=3401576 RepID=UPI003AAB9414